MKNRTYTNALTRHPSPKMANGITSKQEKVNFELAKAQHQRYITKLKDLNINVITLDADPDFPDSHFVEDAAIIHNGVAIMTHPGAKTRRGEVARMKPELEKLMPVFDFPQDENILLDGGDVIFIGNKILIGVYERTNLKGAQFLKSILSEVDPTLEFHIIPFSGVLHLKTGLTPLSETVLIGNPAITLHQKLDFAKIHWLPEEEGYAANTLTVNGTTFHFEESQSANRIIKDAGLAPLPMQLTEFRKMDGSFTCLSLLW